VTILAFNSPQYRKLSAYYRGGPDDPPAPPAAAEPAGA